MKELKTVAQSRKHINERATLFIGDRYQLVDDGYCLAALRDLEMRVNQALAVRQAEWELRLNFVNKHGDPIYQRCRAGQIFSATVMTDYSAILALYNKAEQQWADLLHRHQATN